MADDRGGSADGHRFWGERRTDWEPEERYADVFSGPKGQERCA